MPQSNGIDPVDLFLTYPIGSLLTQPASKDSYYLAQIKQLPKNLKQLIASPKASAFIRGVAKTYNIPLEQSPAIAFATLQVIIGEKPAAALAHSLAETLKIAENTARTIAQEIEQELLTPVMLDLHARAQQPQRQAPIPPPAAGGARNVLDLKSKPQPPLPPPIPR